MRVILWVAGAILAVVSILYVAFCFSIWRATRSDPSAVLDTVRSKDGTALAFERSGSGPAIVLVGGALSDRAAAAGLARHLAPTFRVINYDRRGRGRSADTPPYAVEREVEDIEALVNAAGGSAYLFGSSSGAALALEAMSRLGPGVSGLFMYEPPFIVDASRPPMPDDLAADIERLVAGGRRDDAVGLFFTRAMGIPPAGVTLMRWLMPGWSGMAGMAHTAPYDLAVLAGTQTGRPLPAARWASAQAPTLVMVGSRSEPFFHSGAKAVAALLPQAQYRVLEGRDHSAVLLAPKDISAAVNGFFLGGR